MKWFVGIVGMMMICVGVFLGFAFQTGGIVEGATTERERQAALEKKTKALTPKIPTDTETLKALEEAKAAMVDKEGDDTYLTAFEKSQSALEKAKKAYAASELTGLDKENSQTKFNSNGTLLQYDAVMPVFWDKALLAGQDNLIPLFYEPGSFRDYGKSYVPTYEDSVFLSSSTGLPEYSALKNRPDQMSGFCEQLGTNPDALEQKCNSLDADVCASTECCVLLGGSKCVAGDTQGPATPSNYSDFTIQNRDFYYFKGKCYGNCYQNGASSMYVNTSNKSPNKDAVTAARDEQANANIEAAMKSSKKPNDPILEIGNKLKAVAGEKSNQKPKEKLVYNVGEVVNAQFATKGGSTFTKDHGYEVWYPATLVQALGDGRWTVKWISGTDPVKNVSIANFTANVSEDNIEKPEPTATPTLSPRS